MLPEDWQTKDWKVIACIFWSLWKQASDDAAAYEEELHKLMPASVKRIRHIGLIKMLESEYTEDADADVY